MGDNPSYFDYDNERARIRFKLDIAGTIRFTPQHPVEHVSWYDAQEFLDSLNKITGKKFRLPTEAEWEYAAAGGKFQEKFRYSGSNRLDLVGQYCTPDRCAWTQEVGLLKPNILGIYDMSGNVAEWCSDWYDANYYEMAEVFHSPKGPATGTKKVIRGGGLKMPEIFARITTRSSLPAEYQSIEVGLRLVR